MIVKRVKQSDRGGAKAASQSGGAAASRRTSDYVRGLDERHAAATAAGERIEATGYSCPGRPEVQDIDEAARWLDREAEAYQMQGGQGRPYDHWVISFEAGERPTEVQVAEAVEIFRRNLGVPPEAPLLWGLHNDTKNFHIHAQVSTVIANNWGRLEVRSLNTVDVTRDDKRGGRLRFYAHKAASRACAEICERQGWDAKNLAWDKHGQRVTKAVPADGVRLPPRIKDYEATHRHQHPAHVLALAALPILAAAQSRAEAVAGLAAIGIEMDIKPTKSGRDGAVLSSPISGGRLALSALPRECALSSIDARAAAMGRPIASQATPASPPRVSGAGAVRLAQPQRTAAPWTPARVGNQAKRIISGALSWSDILTDFRREGWTLARAGKSGAVIVAKSADGAPEIRVKMSDVPGRNSLNNITKKFDDLTLEDAVESGKISRELFDAVVTYPQAEKAAEKAAILAVGNAQEIPTDPNAIILPQNALDEEALSGQPSALRKLGEVARDTIRESLSQDKSIVQTIDRLAQKGIQIELFQKEGVGLVSLRLSAVGIKGSLALSSLPADCRLKALAAKFNEKYRETPDKRHYNPEAAKAAELVEIDPEDDLIEIIRKNLAKIASQNAHGTKIFDWSRDTRKLKKVEEKPADESAALDISAPVDLKGAEKEAWKAGELVKHEFKSALAAYNKQTEENNGTRSMWDFVIPALEKRGWRLEMTETGAQVSIKGQKPIDLAELELNFTAYCKIFGEPNIEMKKEGLSREELQNLKEEVQFARFAQFAAMDVRNIFKGGDFDAIMSEIEARGWRIEAAGNSAQIIVNDRLTVPLWHAKVDYEDLCEKWGREPAFQIAGWREMSAQQQHFEMQKRQLRQIFRAKSWESIVQRLELQGARLELTKNGEGGRVVLKDGTRVKISEFTRSLKTLRERKQGDLNRLMAVREAAKRTERAIERQKAMDARIQEQKRPKQQETSRYQVPSLKTPPPAQSFSELRNIVAELRKTNPAEADRVEKEALAAQKARNSRYQSMSQTKQSTTEGHHVKSIDSARTSAK
ncbi:relaxase/mobilization nuclease domain-containing protein [Solidesulfovibrio carbinolicus]|uniref:MobA/VirD2-like nuclease domain-containing protein n=1 Tax=Solidesulfovibrio carbinolicus TaxID=296842 RepID=A0A4P6HKK4_9BACT|nr:relaxase/mobilization nuclease domain-containing protein [Solidesulfovibrio carbinolicus]QAZ67465.1 hypothetical protein C3Y92_09610 [Solidesulfovibrio carbinolicus]